MEGRTLGNPSFRFPGRPRYISKGDSRADMTTRNSFSAPPPLLLKGSTLCQLCCWFCSSSKNPGFSFAAHVVQQGTDQHGGGFPAEPVPIQESYFVPLGKEREASMGATTEEGDEASAGCGDACGTEQDLKEETGPEGGEFSGAPLLGGGGESGAGTLSIPESIDVYRGTGDYYFNTEDVDLPYGECKLHPGRKANVCVPPRGYVPLYTSERSGLHPSLQGRPTSDRFVDRKARGNAQVQEGTQ
ncbi:unnamed protein product [Amoebophrya sp. A120]|nr:unnamed protein product [Amoebophrya sp. A120]|eukprot:GSA120T00007859001.1